MTDICEAYYKWLGIPPKTHPPDHYRLLGIERFETDPDVIRDAADRQMMHVRNYQLGQYSDLSQQLLNELAAARVCLLNPERKISYDNSLRRQAGARPIVIARPMPVPHANDLAGQEPVLVSAVHTKAIPRWHQARSGWGPMFLGFGGTSVVVLVVVMIWWGVAGGSRQEEPAAASRAAVDLAGTTAPSGDKLPPPAPPVPTEVSRSDADVHWANAGEEVANVGRVRVRVLSAEVDRPPVLRPTGRIAMPNQEYLVVTLELANTDATAKVEYVGWGGGICGTERVVLMDDSGESYPVKLFAGGEVEGQQRNMSLYVDQPVRDVLVFERPTDAAEYLRLSLPGEAVGAEEVARFEIPRRMITKPVLTFNVPDDPGTHEPVQPATAPQEPEKMRQPPPALAEQQKVRRTLEDVYDLAAARTSGEKLQLVARLVKLAQETEDTTERFVLLRQASELAAAAGETLQVLQLVEQMAEEFEIDRLAAQAYLLNGMVESVAKEEQIQAFLVGSAAVIYDAVDAERFDVADALSAAVCSACQCPVGRPFCGEARERRQEVETIRERWSQVQAAREVLQTIPEDEKANTIVGEWHCLVRDEWDQGLPYLAKGADMELRELADRETREMHQDAKAQVAMADAWWEFVKAPGKKRHVLWEDRAAYWYEQAYPELDSPLLKAKVEKRLDEMGRTSPGSSSEDGQGTGGIPYDNPSLSSTGHRQLSDLLSKPDDTDSEEPVEQSSVDGEPCPTCKSKGVIYTKCPNRHCARGTVRDYRYQTVGRNPVTGQKIVHRIPVRVPCPVCGGSYIKKEQCPDCDGTGVKQDSTK